MSHISNNFTLIFISLDAHFSVPLLVVSQCNILFYLCFFIVLAKKQRDINLRRGLNLKEIFYFCLLRRIRLFFLP